MNKGDIQRYSDEGAQGVEQIAREEGWSEAHMKAAWEYTVPFQHCIKQYVADVPQELMRAGFVIMINALKAVLNGTTQAEFEAERGELNEEDLA